MLRWSSSEVEEDDILRLAESLIRNRQRLRKIPRLKQLRQRKSSQRQRTHLHQLPPCKAIAKPRSFVDDLQHDLSFSDCAGSEL